MRTRGVEGDPTACDRQGMKRIAVVALMVVGLGIAHAERLRAPNGEIKDVPESSVDFALKDGYTRLPKVHMKTPDGCVVMVDEDIIDDAKLQGFWLLTKSERDDVDRNGDPCARERARRQDDEQGAQTKRANDWVWGAAFGGLLLAFVVYYLTLVRKKRQSG